MSKQSNRAPPIGRSVRIVVGLLLVVYVTPIYLRLPSRVFFASLLLMFGLLVAYCVIHIVISRRVVAVGPSIATILVHVLLVALYVAGFSRASVFGNGNGQLAAVTFFGLSLFVAGIRGVSGCELMAIPSLFLRKNVELPCLIFSPLDNLERRLRIKRDT